MELKPQRETQLYICRTKLITKEKSGNYMINYAHKYRIYPNKEQQELIWKNINGARFVYNALLADAKQQYEETGKSKLKLVTWVKNKPENYFLKDCDNNCLDYSRTNLSQAYQNFFRGIKKHQKVGFPKFKNYHKCAWSYKTRVHKGEKSIRLEDDHIKLPKISPIKIVLHRPLPDDCRIISATVSMTKSGEYYVSIGFEVPDDHFKNVDYHTDKAIGLDLGIKDFVITSDGKKFSNMHAIKKSEKKLIKADRALARKQNGSMGRVKAKIKRAKVYERLQNQRKAYLHNISKYLIVNYDKIAIEDLNVKGMMANHKLAKAVGDVSLYEFTRQLQYKADWYDKEVKKIDRFYPSSQTCNDCGYRLEGADKLTLGDREWACPNCGVIHDRDINAAKNIRDEAFKK